MKLDINVNNKREHTNLWLTLFQAGSGLTDREKTVLTEIILRRDSLLVAGIKEPFLTKLLFDADSRKIYCDELDITSFNLTNILSSLKTKGAISEDFKIMSTLIPDDSLTFSFSYDSK